MEHIVSLSLRGDFYSLRYGFPLIITNNLGELVFNFAVLHDLEQQVRHPIHIRDCLGDMPNILDIFLHPTLLFILLSIFFVILPQSYSHVCILSSFLNCKIVYIIPVMVSGTVPLHFITQEDVVNYLVVKPSPEQLRCKLFWSDGFCSHD